MPIHVNRKSFEHVSLVIMVNLLALAVIIGLTELGLRVFLPDFREWYSVNFRFSERYHHIGPALTESLKQVRQREHGISRPFKVVVLGDSFIAAYEVPRRSRSTSLLQSRLDQYYPGVFDIINLGEASYSTMIYERVLVDTARPLQPNLVIIALDQTDMIDDEYYARDLASEDDASAPFANTLLEQLSRTGLRAYLYANSRVFLMFDRIFSKWGHSLMPPRFVQLVEERNREKLRWYIETCRSPEANGWLFPRQREIMSRIDRFADGKFPVIFVTFPHAEHIAGQPKTTLINGAIPNDASSAVYFEYWIEATGLPHELRSSRVVHAADAFREVSERGEILYFNQNDIHWNPAGHKVFADYLYPLIVEAAYRAKVIAEPEN